MNLRLTNVLLTCVVFLLGILAWQGSRTSPAELVRSEWVSRRDDAKRNLDFIYDRSVKLAKDVDVYARDAAKYDRALEKAKADRDLAFITWLLENPAPPVPVGSRQR